MSSTHRTIQIGGGLWWAGHNIFLFTTYLAVRAREEYALSEYVNMFTTYASTKDWALEHYDLSQWVVARGIFMDLKALLSVAQDGQELVTPPIMGPMRMQERYRSLALSEIDELLCVIDKRIAQLQSV